MNLERERERTRMARTELQTNTCATCVIHMDKKKILRHITSLIMQLKNSMVLTIYNDVIDEANAKGPNGIWLLDWHTNNLAQTKG